MGDVIKVVEKTIEDHDLIKPGDKILVAFSGGPDSTALLSILNILQNKLRIEIGAAHIDHQIRKKSLRDLDFCKIFCKRSNIKFHYKSINIPRIAALEKRSLEETGRNVRYRFLDNIVKKYGYSKTATGHTSDDNAETIFFNIVRGTGLAGLRGIPIRRDNIIRPLIRLSKQEIINWLIENKIRYANDSSNLSSKFSRNRIRNQIFPLIERINPGFKGNLIRLSSNADEELEIIEQLIENVLKNAVVRRSKCKIVLDLRILEQYHKSLIKKAVFVAFQGVGTKIQRLSSNEFAQIMELIKAKSGAKMIFADDIMIQNSQGLLAISLLNKPVIRLMSRIQKLNIPGKTVIPECDKWIESTILHADFERDLKSTSDMAFLDHDKIKNPKIRFKKNGDKIKPLGMKGHKLVSDILIERKIPQFERNQIPIIVSGNKIAWIGGVMIADEFKVTKSTEKILNLKLCEH